eukprot:c4939_g1_i1 orf=351-704(-)
MRLAVYCCAVRGFVTDGYVSRRLCFALGNGVTFSVYKGMSLMVLVGLVYPYKALQGKAVRKVLDTRLDADLKDRAVDNYKSFHTCPWSVSSSDTITTRWLCNQERDLEILPKTCIKI